MQTSSATAEQSAAASQELSGQAVTLKRLVGEFSLKDDGEEFFSQEPMTSIQKSTAFEEESKYWLRPCDGAEFAGAERFFLA